MLPKWANEYFIDRKEEVKMSKIDDYKAGNFTFPQTKTYKIDDLFIPGSPTKIAIETENYDDWKEILTFISAFSERKIKKLKEDAKKEMQEIMSDD